MKRRFFYAAPTHNTWAKLFVLTEDGKFYCEFLDYNKPAKVLKDFNFDSFKQENYKWNGYQSIIEIDEQKAISTKLTNQPNWISNYVNNL